jgi:hypothetical protein
MTLVHFHIRTRHKRRITFVSILLHFSIIMTDLDVIIHGILEIIKNNYEWSKWRSHSDLHYHKFFL